LRIGWGDARLNGVFDDGRISDKGGWRGVEDGPDIYGCPMERTQIVEKLLCKREVKATDFDAFSFVVDFVLR
jgi:hypothetical protein